MAKCVLTIEDDFKDGQQIIKGQFDVIDGPVSHDGSEVMFQPSQLIMATIQRLWDAGVINTHVRAYAADMLQKNQAIQYQRAAAEQAAKEAALQAASSLIGVANDADKPLIDRAGAADAEMVDIDAVAAQNSAAKPEADKADPAFAGQPEEAYSEPTVVAGVGKAKGQATAALGALVGTAVDPADAA